jgi:iron complex transport system substrate-binding protein
MDSLADYQTDAPATRRDFANIVYRARRMTTFVPSSSSYYETPREGHTYGWFADLTWRDPDFDTVETCVQAGFIGYDGDKYNPDGPVTREQLAKTVFLTGDFSAKEPHAEIKDLESCENPRIVQALVDNGVFELRDGMFEPGRAVTCGEITGAFEYVNGL